jgi:chromate transporter
VIRELGTHQSPASASPVSASAPDVAALARYFLGLGTWGFGGPVVLVERMRRDLQESRGWFTLDEYREGLALAQLAPGPLAAQLAIYLGWVRAGVLGATAVGFAFILPSFLMVMALSVVYVRFGGLPWMQGAFYGVGAAVIAVIGYSAFRLTRKTVGTDRLLWGVVILNAALTAATQREIVWVILGSGLFVLLIRALPRTPIALALIPAWTITGLRGPAEVGTISTILLYFAKGGALVFGSGLAIVPFLHGGVVRDMHWLTEQQFLDAVAVSMITPGPVVITVAFIGYLVAGPLGAAAAAAGVFLPVYVIVVSVARWFHRRADAGDLRRRAATRRASEEGTGAGAAARCRRDRHPRAWEAVRCGT